MHGWDGGKSKQRLCSQPLSALVCKGTAGVPFAGAQHHQHWPREAAAGAGGPGTEHHHFHFQLLDVLLHLPACSHHWALVSKGCHHTAPRVGGTDHQSLLSTPGDQRSKTEVPSGLALWRAVGENLLPDSVLDCRLSSPCVCSRCRPSVSESPPFSKDISLIG